MNTNVTLYPHQKDAVWRVMCGGNTLLAHAVGAGKTNEMAAAGMKMKEAGLIKKPLYVVPNHMLEQFGREFMHLYPNAKLLIAGKEDFTKERRKLLTAKMASGHWDGIIVTHSSFERLGMSRGYQQQFLREQIAEYEALLADSALDKSDRGQRNLLKTIEKQKAQREERLKDLLAEDKKDDGLVFDELGVNHIFIDESHYFKNLETPTKMERVAGIQTGGSERAFDLYMKCRYLDRQHPGHGVTFATGTPVSNTMVEMYTIQRYLDPHGLSERGIDHFDAWAATFGEVVDAMEISPDGKTLRPRSRFAKFTNLPELQQMFRAFADVKTAQMLDLPRPRLTGGKPAVIACPMSEAQCSIQEQLIARYEAIRSGKVKPWEDNALAITTDGRKLALDARLLDAHATENPESKINALVANVAAIWQRTASTRGTQLIFSDMGVNPHRRQPAPDMSPLSSPSGGRGKVIKKKTDVDNPPWQTLELTLARTLHHHMQASRHSVGLPQPLGKNHGINACFEQLVQSPWRPLTFPIQWAPVLAECRPHLTFNEPYIAYFAIEIHLGQLAALLCPQRVEMDQTLQAFDRQFDVIVTSHKIRMVRPSWVAILQRTRPARP